MSTASGKPDRLAFLKAPASFDEDGFNLSAGRTEIGDARLRVLFGAWDDADATDGDEDMAALKAIHQQARDGYLQIVEVLHQVANDDDATLDGDGRLKIAARAIEPRLTALSQVADREVAKATEAIARERAEIQKAARVIDPVDLSTHGEIRQHWQRMKDDAAREARTQPSVLANLDLATLQALATGPEYLSGLSKEAQARVRAELGERVSPARAARVRALEDGIGRVANALAALDRKANKFLDFPKARALRERERARDARYGVRE